MIPDGIQAVPRDPESGKTPLMDAANSAAHGDSPGVENVTEGTIVAVPAPAGGQAAGQPAPAPESLFSSPLLWIMLLGFIAFQFIFSSKNRKRQQAEAEKLKSLAKGDRVLTIGRMHGTVVALTDETMTLKTDDKGANTLVFDRAALYKILSRPDEKAGEEKK